MRSERQGEERDGGGASRRRGFRMREGAARAAVIVALAAWAAATFATAASPTKKESPYFPAKATGRAMEYYAAYGGVDELHVQLTASGNLVRLSYRVIDAVAAKALVDKSITPYLFALRSHALLQVPVMEQIGPLRQTGELEAGKAYWMVFSNKGSLVKAGDRVSVIVGTYHIDGLMVE